MTKILVTGGAGYIGSHTVRCLLKKRHEVIVLDNLEKGHEKSLPNNLKLIKGDVGDKKLLDKLFREEKIEVVMHFAGLIEAGESMKDPQKYFNNNTVATLNLLQSMIKNKVKKIIFSSTAAVYGEPKSDSIDESHPKKPINYYGLSKLFIEQILKAYDSAYNLKYISLRYFNAAGADGDIGENHKPETHLIPLVIKTALGEREDIKIFGTDYNTPDGTCIRDYVHVNDLANAHIKALEYLSNNNKSEEINLGTNKGHSIKQIIDMVKEVSNKDFKVVEIERRKGDPAILIANYELAKKLLGWTPTYSLNQIISSAWEWHSKYPLGFGG